MLNSPSIPPSPTSTPEPRSEVDETDLRPVDEIRADLSAVAVGVGIRGRLSETEAAHRLLADAEPLLAALAAVERERDEARRIGRLDGQEANNLLVWAEGAEERVNAALARAVAAERERDEACAQLETVAAQLRQCIDERNHRIKERVAAEARLAAVERAIPSILAPIDTIRHSLDCTMRPVIYNGARCSCDLPSHIRRAVQAELHAALAAPSPQAEPATCHHGRTVGHWLNATSAVSVPPWCPGPQSTEETR